MKLYLYCLLVYLAAMLMMIGLCDVMKAFSDWMREQRQRRALRKVGELMKTVREEIAKR